MGFEIRHSFGTNICYFYSFFIFKVYFVCGSSFNVGTMVHTFNSPSKKELFITFKRELKASQKIIKNDWKDHWDIKGI